MKKRQAKRKRRANAPWIAIRHLATALALREQTLREQTATRTHEGPPRFVQCWTQQRGAFGVLHALDADGQVWELHTVMDQGTKAVTEQWWTPIRMERRKP